MDGYAIIGLTLFFTTVVLLGYFLWHSHRTKKDLDDQGLKRAAIIIRLRNTATILAMFGFSVFLLLLSSMPQLSPGTEEYTARDNLSAYVLYAGLAMLAAATCLSIISRRAEFNFKRLLQIHAVKEKLHATLKFKRKPKRTTRI